MKSLNIKIKNIFLVFLSFVFLFQINVVFASTPISKNYKYINEKVSEIKLIPENFKYLNEWSVISYARNSDNTDFSVFDSYYKDVEGVLKEAKGNITKTKYTEYSRLILSLTAINKDVTNVSGYNLLEKLADFNSLTKQGINGPIFALLALDSKNYNIPYVKDLKVITTRQKLIDYILSKEIEEDGKKTGAFSMDGINPDVDITAMAVQSLAKYSQDKNASDALNRALIFISKSINKDGKIVNNTIESSESIAQVMVALSSMGIDFATDKRFVSKDGKTLLDGLNTFKVSNGYCHTIGGESNTISTEQSLYALVSYKRLLNNKTSLYDMSDVGINISDNLIIQ